jgi:predicted glycosyltransferase
MMLMITSWSNYQFGEFPIKYLGVPMSHSKFHITDWLPSNEKIAKKLDICQGSSLSIARSVMIAASFKKISNISMYLLAQTTIEYYWEIGQTETLLLARREYQEKKVKKGESWALKILWKWT